MTANHNNFDSTESEAHPVETTEETIMLDENVSILSASEGDSSIVADLEMHEDVKQPEEVVAHFSSNPEQKAQVESSVLEDAVVDHVLEQADVKEKKVKYEEAVQAGQPQR